MKYVVKVVSTDTYELTELRLGARVQYIEVEFGNEKYQGLLDSKRRDTIILPEYFADKILTELINEK